MLEKLLILLFRPFIVLHDLLYSFRLFLIGFIVHHHHAIVIAIYLVPFELIKVVLLLLQLHLVRLLLTFYILDLLDHLEVVLLEVLHGLQKLVNGAIRDATYVRQND